MEEIDDLIDKIDHDTDKGVPKSEIDDLLRFIKTTLGKEVSNVKSSQRLISQSCVVSGHVSSSLKDMMKLMERENSSQYDQFKQYMQQQNPVTLEINPNHQLLVKLNSVRKLDQEVAKDIV